MSSEFEIVKLKNENKKLKKQLIHSEANRIYNSYCDNPDVGLPCSYEYCLEEACKYLKISTEETEKFMTDHRNGFTC